MNAQAADVADVLATFSDQLAGAVERAGASVVQVDARRRQAASGIVWSADGLVLTADHVLERDEDLAVGLPDGKRVGVKIVGRDPASDLALLKAEALDLTPLQQGPPPKVGQMTLIVARPGGGLETSIGVVSSLGGHVHTGHGGLIEGIIRTDAVFYPGFSGAPLIDAAGRMVGLATSHFGQGARLGIPLDTIGRVTAALQAHGRVKHGFIGLGSQPIALPEAIRARVGGQDGGLMAVAVEPNGPADKAGVIIGDVLVALGGRQIRNIDDLRTQLGPDKVGQSLPARVVRGGEPRDLTVTIGERA